MASEPERIGSRLLDIAITVLLGAMALWGAVAIVKSIWLWLCIGLAVAGVVTVVVWWRRSRW